MVEQQIVNLNDVGSNPISRLKAPKRDGLNLFYQRTTVGWSILHTQGLALPNVLQVLKGSGNTPHPLHLNQRGLLETSTGTVQQHGQG